MYFISFGEMRSSVIVVNMAKMGPIMLYIPLINIRSFSQVVEGSPATKANMRATIPNIIPNTLNPTK
jgi:hypothetical protein